jgi:hypothetical protein
MLARTPKFLSRIIPYSKGKRATFGKVEAERNHSADRVPVVRFSERPVSQRFWKDLMPTRDELKQISRPDNGWAEMEFRNCKRMSVGRRNRTDDDGIFVVQQHCDTAVEPNFQ